MEREGCKLVMMMERMKWVVEDGVGAGVGHMPAL